MSTVAKTDRTVWSLVTGLVVCLAILNPPQTGSADLLYENNASPATTIFWTPSADWNTFGDLIMLDSPGTMTSVAYHMFANGATESNLAFYLYENDNDTVGDLIWSDSITGATSTGFGRIDFVFNNLSVAVPDEMFMAVAIQNPTEPVDGFYFGPVIGQNPTVGSSDSKSLIAQGGFMMQGLAPGTPLEIDLDDTFFANNLQITINSTIPEPGTGWLAGCVICLGLVLRRARNGI